MFKTRDMDVSLWGSSVASGGGEVGVRKGDREKFLWRGEDRESERSWFGRKESHVTHLQQFF
jgi:hypothetical protein